LPFAVTASEHGTYRHKQSPGRDRVRRQRLRPDWRGRAWLSPSPMGASP